MSAAKRILLVEDDPALARVVSDNLALEGFEIRHAITGRDALDASGEFRPDLVLLDVMLPDTTGFELAGLLRRSGSALIFISARGQKNDKLVGLDLGADDYVTKPFDI